MIFEARSLSRRCTTVTSEQSRVRKFASSIAVSPPPITATGTLRKKAPSQVAHALTPLPIRLRSDSSPRYMALAPVATITVRVSIARPSDISSRCAPPPSKEAPVTSPLSKRVPNRSAWRRITVTSSVPSTPFSKPG